MDPPEETEDAASPHRRRQRRRGTLLHIQWTLLLTVRFVILSLFKLELAVTSEEEEEEEEETTAF